MPIEQKLREPNRRELASTGFPYEAARYYSLKVENEGPRIKAYIDGKLVLQAEDRELLKGKAGVTSNIPARFQDFRVDASDSARDAIRKRIALRDAELESCAPAIPNPSSGRNFRSAISALAATSASAISMATASLACSSART